MKQYDNWELDLFTNQFYPGRSLVKYRDHKTDLNEIDAESRQELFEKVLPDIKNALDSIFSPDLYNYASLGNDCRHLHIHIIPRYKEDREFEGVEFSDENWNSHYMPYDTEFEIPEQVFEKIKIRITEVLR